MLELFSNNFLLGLGDESYYGLSDNNVNFSDSNSNNDNIDNNDNIKWEDVIYKPELEFNSISYNPIINYNYSIYNITNKDPIKKLDNFLSNLYARDIPKRVKNVLFINSKNTINFLFNSGASSYIISDISFFSNFTKIEKTVY